MRVRFTPEALLAVREKRAWWLQHRDKAPRLVRARACRDRGEAPRWNRFGSPAVAARRGQIIWRILMPKTRNHIYYRVNDRAAEVEVLLVWNATAGRAPDV